MSHYTKDFLERVIRTFIAAVLAVVVAGLTNVVDWSSVRALGLSAITAGVTAVLAVVAKRINDPTTASVLPSEVGDD